MTEADLDSIIDRLRENGNLAATCRELGFVRTTFLKRCDEDEALRDRYARAKAEGIDAVMEEIRDAEITDPAKDRLDWDRKRWHASKLLPKKYGDKIAVGGADDLPPVKTIDVSGISTDALRELARLGAADK